MQYYLLRYWRGEKLISAYDLREAQAELLATLDRRGISKGGEVWQDGKLISRLRVVGGRIEILEWK